MGGCSFYVYNITYLSFDCNSLFCLFMCLALFFYETGYISTLHEMKAFFTMVRELFPEIDTLIRSERHDADRETAERLIKKGKMTLEDIAECVPSLSFDELRKLEAEVMQLA